MSEQTTNPVEGESSLTLDTAAEAINNLFAPKDSKKEQPPGERGENSASDDSTAQVEETSDEASDKEHTEEEGVDQQADEDKILFGEEEIPVSQLKEWRDSGLRLQDYTKKTQELAQQRKEFEENRAKEEETFRKQWQERLAQYADVSLNALKPFQDINWDQLRAEDPYQYQTLWADYQRAERQAAKVQQDIQRAIDEENQKASLSRQALLKEEANNAKKLIPELSDPVKAKDVLQRMTAYTQTVGLTPEQIADISDSKALKIIYDAMHWHELQAKGSSVKKTVVVSRVAKPGSPQANKEIRSERANKRIAEVDNRLRRTGRIDDAAAAIAARLRK